MSKDPDGLVELSDDEKALVVERKATCPFIGSAVARGALPVHGVEQPVLRELWMEIESDEPALEPVVGGQRENRAHIRIEG